MAWKPIARIFGNTGTYFVATYAGTAVAGLASLEIAGFTALIGLIISTSRELLEYGKQRRV